MATPAGHALSAEEGQRLGSATGPIAPAWASRDELNGAVLIALAHSDKGNTPLVIRGIDPVSGTPQNLDIVLPATVGGSGTLAVRWDLAHGRLLVLARTTTPVRVFSISGWSSYRLKQEGIDGNIGIPEFPPGGDARSCRSPRRFAPSQTPPASSLTKPPQFNALLGLLPRD